MPPPVFAREIPWRDPLEAFGAFLDLPGAAFLDSAQQGERLGRYSFIAADPFLILKSKDGRISLDERTFTGDPFALLARLQCDRCEGDRSAGITIRDFPSQC